MENSFYIMYKKEENVNLNKLKEDIKNKNIRPLYYLYGEETYLLRRYVINIKKILKEENVSIIEYNSDSYNDIEFYENLYENSIFGEKKLFIIDNLKFINRNFKPEIIKALIDNVDEYYAIFIDYETEYKYENNYKFRKIDDIEDLEEAINKDTKKKEKIDYLLNVINHYGLIVNFSKLDKTEVKKTIVSLLKKNEKTIDNFTIDYLIELVGLELNNVINELEKLVAFVGDREKISKEDIDKVVSRVLNEEIFTFIDMINQNNKTEAVKLYSDLVLKNIPNRMIFNLIKDNYSNIFTVKSKMLKGLKTNEIAKDMKFPEWRVEKYIRAATPLDESFIIDKLNQINDMNYDSMTGNIKDNFLVELLI